MTGVLEQPNLPGMEDAPSSDATSSEPAASFEQTLERLREVVLSLEASDKPLPLETALTLFEEGVQLTRSASSAVETAERRVEVLLEDGASAPFEPVGADGPEG